MRSSVSQPSSPGITMSSSTMSGSMLAEHAQAVHPVDAVDTS